MDSGPRVSVIMAAYNVETYIEKSIVSALGQSVDDIEIIVVDDASSDATASVVRNFSDPRLKLFQNDRNEGPAYSRNRAIREANGDWIAILDADDWWAPNRLEILVEIAQYEGAQIIADDLHLIEDGEEIPWNTYLRSRETVIGPMDSITEITAVKMVEEDYGILQPVIRREFLIQHGVSYKDHLVFGEDYVFILDCLLGGAKMLICPEAYYYYRSRVGSLTNTELANTQAQYNLLLQLHTSQPYNLFPEVHTSLSSRLLILEISLKEDYVKGMFLKKKFLEAASVIVNNPMLLISFARHIKHRLFSG